MSKPKVKGSTVTLWLGMLLLLTAALLLCITQISQKQAAADVKTVSQKLYSLMPSVHTQLPDDRVNVMMPAIQVEGISYCGIIELPLYGTALPICASWDKTAALSVPCKYMGSVYDGSLMIGGSDKQGQFDFVQQITKGDRVYITDMTGGKYAYTVSVVKKASHLPTEYLESIDADLVLFARNSFSLDHTVIGCVWDP